jgi:large subunit ribosomal protein L1
MGTKRNVTISTNEDTIKVLAPQEEMNPISADTAVNEEGGESVAAEPKAKAKTSRTRGKRYKAVRAQVDKTKLYTPLAAVELLQKLSYSKFVGTITADLVLREENTQVSLTFPHSVGKSVRVAIVDEAVLKAIEEGKIEFDVLITEPRFMPQLAKFARTLGPKGLMPNPKNGTVTANPELKKKELEGGKVTVKSEKKAPLMHTVIGKTDMTAKAVVENLAVLNKALTGKVLKISLSATMSPSVKVVVE